MDTSYNKKTSSLLSSSIYNNKTFHKCYPNIKKLHIIARFLFTLYN